MIWYQSESQIKVQDLNLADLKSSQSKQSKTSILIQSRGTLQTLYDTNLEYRP